MYLRPGKIRFCQDSICTFFDKQSEHANSKIGFVLDALLIGECDVADIPTITVVNSNGVWYTLNNRRLWVFRKLEELGHCKKIPVIEDDYIPSGKLTTFDGTSIYVRGDPGGHLWKRMEDQLSDDESSDDNISDDENSYSEHSNDEYSDDSSYDESDGEKFSEDEYSQDESINGEYSDDRYSNEDSGGDDDQSSDNNSDEYSNDENSDVEHSNDGYSSEESNEESNDDDSFNEKSDTEDEC